MKLNDQPIGVGESRSARQSQKIRKKNNKGVTPISKKRIWTQEQILDIIDLYANKGMTMNFIKDKYSTKAGVISKILRDNNIEIKRTGCTKNRLLKEDYFDVIDSEAKAYLLGFITADGSVHYRKRNSNKGVLRLGVQIRDIEIINLLKHELNSGSKIIYDKREKKETVLLSVSSDKIVKSLAKYGVVPNKTYSLDSLYKDFNNEDLFRHYLRGLIDGDGCITSTKNEQHWLLYFCSYSKMMALDFKDTINKMVGLSIHNNVYDCKTSYRAAWNKKEDVCKICKFLYTNCNYYLTRKYQKANMVFENKEIEDMV